MKVSVRKAASVLMVGGLVFSLLGSGVGASFTDSVTAALKINVGTFSCAITNATAGTIAPDGKSVEYDAPAIMSSAAGQSPMSFTVQNSGSIPAVLTITPAFSASVPDGLFSDMLTVPAPVALAALGTTTYNGGIQWNNLGTANLGEAVSVLYTVNCNEDQSAVTFASVLDPDGVNVDNTVTGSGFAAGPVAVTVSVQYGASVAFTVTNWFPTNTDASGNFVIGPWQDNCADNIGVVQHGTQTVTVTATDGGHTATGTGSAPCP